MNLDQAPSWEIEPPNPPNDGILFVHHALTGRSGHLGHALVEYAPGQILAFYPNCSAMSGGHTGDGWMEYKRSTDGGHTWSAPAILEYSKQTHESGRGRSVMCEKAVRAVDGAIVLFNLECENIAAKKWMWQPLGVPTFLRSTDAGATWGAAQPLSDQPGRIYAAISHAGCIFVLELCNDSKIKWHSNLPEHHYALYVSTDAGRTFARRSRLPFSHEGRGYGALTILPDGGLIAYVYNINDEQHLDYVISHDAGETWSAAQTAFMAKQIRNPQIAAFKGGYVLHGRSGNKGAAGVPGHFVLYTSRDGIHWDDGRYLQRQQAGWGAYSNNLLVSGPAADAPPRLLIQASHAYENHKTNIHHWWLR